MTARYCYVISVETTVNVPVLASEIDNAKNMGGYDNESTKASAIARDKLHTLFAENNMNDWQFDAQEIVEMTRRDLAQN